MKQDPIDPTPKIRKMTFAINGNPIGFDADMIPKLFVAYIAAVRAEYYAGVDDAANPGCFDTVFHEEVRHGMRDRSELEDWMQNNMDVTSEKADEIGVALLDRCPVCDTEDGQPHARGCLETGYKP